MHQVLVWESIWHINENYNVLVWLEYREEGEENEALEVVIPLGYAGNVYPYKCNTKQLK